MADVIYQDEEKAKIVMDYLPKKLVVQISREAESFLRSQPQAQETNFRISDLVAQQTGIQDLEKASIERRVEQIALERLKEIQEKAYHEAYQLGLDEGTQKGHSDAKADIISRLDQFNKVVEQLGKIKLDILQRNEIQIIDLIYYFASQIAMFEIKKNDQRIVPVLRNAMESVQKDEQMTIKISPVDLVQVEELKKISGQEFEFLTRPKFEPTDRIEPGGCVVETNYGLIDATLKERIDKLAMTLDEAKPTSKKDTFE